jgi:hypothetical protein
MILDVSSLAVEISSMEAVSIFMESLTTPTDSLASLIKPFARLAWSAFCLVIEAISSSEEEVSSN